MKHLQDLQGGKKIVHLLLVPEMFNMQKSQSVVRPAWR
ncbi:hypothetical protein CU025_1542 [Enterococcus faecium]|nr:hypothetical protein [Enterococcus faecium]